MNWISLRVFERLERGVGALAVDGAVFAGRGIEVIHAGGRGGALPEGVHAAAVEAFAGVALVIAGVAFRHGHGVPDAVGLIGPHAGAADFVRPAGRRRSGRSRAPSRRPCGSAGRGARSLLAGSLGQLPGVTLRLLAVGGGGDDEAEEFLHVPALFAELDRRANPSSSGWVGSSPVMPKSPGTTNEAGAEDFLPETVHRDAGGQGMLRTQQPLGPGRGGCAAVRGPSPAARRAWPG